MPFLFILLPCIAGAGSPEINPLWTVNLYTFLENGLTLGDVNGDGLDEIITAGREELVALDGSGKELWRWVAPGRLMTYPEVLKTPDSLYIYVADWAGNFSCVDGTGKLVWQAKLQAPASWSGATVCRLDSDASPVVAQADESGSVSAFDALAGSVKWRIQVKGAPATPALVAGTGEGARDPNAAFALTTGAGMLYVLRKDGSVLWEKSIGGSSPTWATSGPVTFVGSDGVTRIVAAATEGRMMCFDAAGNELWSRPTRGSVASSVSVGDLDRDNRPEIFCITQTGVIHRFDENGNTLWEMDTQGRTLAPGVVLDMNGDGRMEYAMSTQSGRLYIFDDAGRCIHEHIFDSRTINVTPAFGEIRKDTPGLELAVTGGEWGLVHCFSIAPGSEDKAAAIAQAEMVPENLNAEQLTTSEPVHFRISGTGNRLRAWASCLRPDGARQSALLPVLYLPAELNLPFDVTAEGEYAFEWTLETADGNLVASGLQKLDLKPYAPDDALAARTIDKLRATTSGISGSMAAASRALVNEADALERFAQEAAKDRARSSELAARARRADAIADAVRAASALGPNTSVIAYEGELWESRGIDLDVPKTAANPVKIARRVVPGEHEPVAVNLFNPLNRDLHVRCIVDDAGAVGVSLHYAQASPSARGDVSWDALPELDESGVLTIPPLMARQVWVDLDFADAAPGAHAVKLRIEALDGAGVLEPPYNPHDVTPPQIEVEIAAEVLPFEMASFGSMRLCAWARLGKAEIDDMLAHGNNVFCAPLPPANFDENGDYKPDYSKLDEVAEPVKGHDVVLLLQGTPEFKDARHAKVYFDEISAHLATFGIDERHFALYPLDEPGGFGWAMINKLIEFGKMAKAARPSIQIYVDGGGELPMFKAIAPYIDIWCPGINMLGEDTPEMKCVRDDGGALWSYNCSYSHSSGVRSCLKNTNIVAEYRIAALCAMRWNATGIGFWCYNIGTNPWSRTELDYPLVYPGRTRPVTSRRWEAVREGMEDARIAAALKAKADAASPDAKERLRKLLDVSLPAMADRCFSDMRLGLNRAAIDMSNNDETMESFRTEMLDCVEALNN
jgi:outer membrane protein assembly factor BamB